MASNSTAQINYKTNNLNLIRLIAACQVLLGHLSQEFHCWSFDTLHVFKGVPIFFTLSGFLIYWSYDNNPKIRQYWTNRCLRIYHSIYGYALS